MFCAFSLLWRMRRRSDEIDKRNEAQKRSDRPCASFRLHNLEIVNLLKLVCQVTHKMLRIRELARHTFDQLFGQVDGPVSIHMLFQPAQDKRCLAPFQALIEVTKDFVQLVEDLSAVEIA